MTYKPKKREKRNRRKIKVGRTTTLFIYPTNDLIIPAFSEDPEL